jgi:hypothetical protein
MSDLDYDQIQRELQDAILDLIGSLEKLDGDFDAMLTEPKVILKWWSGIFEKNEAESALMDKAALAFANSQPLPNLSLAQKGRLAMRLRLGCRVLRVLGHNDPAPKGWLPKKVRNLTKAQLLEWLLVDAWPVWLETLDETLIWAEEVEHPKAFTQRREPDSLSSGETESHSE